MYVGNKTLSDPESVRVEANMLKVNISNNYKEIDICEFCHLHHQYTTFNESGYLFPDGCKMTSPTVGVHANYVILNIVFKTRSKRQAKHIVTCGVVVRVSKEMSRL